VLVELLRQMPAGIVLAEAPSGKILLHNAEAQRIWGRPIESGGDDVWDYGGDDIVHADGRSYGPGELPLARSVRDGEVVTGEELRVHRADGTWAVVAVSTTPIRDEHGQIVAAVATSYDITARAELDEELKKAQGRIQGIIDTVDGIVWEVDLASFCFTYVSQQAERLLGYPIADWYQPNFWTSIILPDDRESAIGYCLECTARHEAHEFEYRVHARDGRLVWLRDIVSVIVENGRAVALRGIMVDVTAQRQTEEQLRQAQKMEAIGNLAGGIAHDFNNLLSIILSYSSMLARQMASGDPRRVELQEIEAAGLRAAELTRQLLAFGRKQILQPKVVNLNDILTGMERMLRRLIGEDIELSVVVDPALGKAKVDPGQIEQIVMNLAVNSRDAMPHGGKLTLETANVELDERYAAEHVGAAAGSHVMLAVSDNGSGMDKATLSRVFEPFFTTKEQGKGTGLGLATVFGIVKQSGGNVFAYSELGKGTTLKVYFPRADALATETEEPGVRTTGLLNGTETILLVEDDEHVRGLARTILQRAGYHVLEARDGGDALRMCRQHPDVIHVLVTDVIMPQMSGRELSEQLALLRPAMKVLFMSGYTDDSIVHHGVLESGVAFLQKPITPQALTRKVREVLAAPRS
jgi:PAS domain S-box-containing protein